MVGPEFCQWTRTICQLMMLVGVGIFLFVRQVGENRRPSHRFGGPLMKNRLLSLEPSYIPVRIRRRVVQREGKKCIVCQNPEEWRVGHIILKQHGGETSFYNLWTLCKHHQRMRGNKTLSEFIAELLLEKIDIFQEMLMRIKIIKYDGKQIEVQVDSRPDLNNVQGFWITYPGNGTQEWIWAKDIKKLTVLRGTKKK